MIFEVYWKAGIRPDAVFGKPVPRGSLCSLRGLSTTLMSITSLVPMWAKSYVLLSGESAEAYSL